MANTYQENKASKPTPMYIESSVIILFIYECVELYTLGIYSISTVHVLVYTYDTNILSNETSA